MRADTRTIRAARTWTRSPRRRGFTTRSTSAGRLDVIAYRATLVDRELVQFVAKLLATERHWRKTPKGSQALTCFWQAVLGRRWPAHGGNVQAVMRPDGLPLWTSPAEPGSVHDITAARIHALPALYRAAAAGADPGYAVSAMPGRTRVRLAHRALARSAAHHRQPFQDRRQHPGSPRPDAFRTWLHHFK